MFLDKQLMFSEGQTVTATANSTNVVDLNTVRDIGIGERLYLALIVTEAMTDSGSDTTVAVSLVTDDNESLTTPATVQALVTIPALAAAGTIYYFPVPQKILNAYERYVGLTYTIANGSLSTGKFTAGIVKDVQNYRNYASGFTIQ